MPLSNGSNTSDHPHSIIQVFLKQEAVEQLSERLSTIQEKATVIQKCIKGYIAYKRYHDIIVKMVEERRKREKEKARADLARAVSRQASVNSNTILEVETH